MRKIPVFLLVLTWLCLSCLVSYFTLYLFTTDKTSFTYVVERELSLEEILEYKYKVENNIEHVEETTYLYTFVKEKFYFKLQKKVIKAYHVHKSI
jgi:hypothetical protein